MKIKHLEKVFHALCQSKASKMNCQTSFDSNKKEVVFTMEFENTKLEIHYTKKNKMFIPPSMIYSRFYFDKNSTIYFHLPEIFAYLEENEFRACYFPYIENIYRMNTCLLSLFELIDDYLEILQTFDHIKINQITQTQREFLLREFSEEDNGEPLDSERNFYEKFYYLNRFSVFEGYYAFLKDDYALALEQYKKLSKKEALTDYEIQLIEYMQNNEYYDAISKECFAMDDVQPYLETSKKNTNDLLKFMFITYIPFVFICVALMALFRYLISKDCLVYCGAPIWWGAVCAVLPAIFGGVALRRTIMKFIKYEDMIQALNFDDVLNSKATNVFAMSTFIVSCFVCMFFIVMLSTESVSFYDSYLTYPKGLIERNTYTYREITKIYHIDARYNDYGDRIERESYILLFDDNEYLDLDGYTTIKVSEKEILPLLNMTIENVDSDKDLEFMKE